MSLPLLHAGRTNPGLSAALDLRFALDKSLTAYRGPTPSFSRASTGSYFDGSGVLRYAALNLLTYSENFSDASWTKASVTVTNDSIVSPDGKTTADTLTENSANATHFVNKASSTSAGTIYTSSIYAKAGTRKYIDVTSVAQDGGVYRRFNNVFDLETGTWQSTASLNSPANTSYSITSVGNGWYRISSSILAYGSTHYLVAYLSNSANPTRDASNDVVYTGNGTGNLYIWGAQLEASSTVGTYCPTTSSANSAPRFNHTYNGTSWVSRGLLVEEQRTNILNYSEDFSDVYWGKSGASVTANFTTAPDGNTTADKFVENSSTSAHVVGRSIGTTSGTQTWSFFAKAAGRNWIAVNAYVGADARTWFNLDAGTVGTNAAGSTATIQNVGNGWYRCSVSRTGGASTYFDMHIANSDNSYVYTGDGTSGLFVWGAQLETGAFPTSYIGTTNSSVVRSADVCQITGGDFSGFYNASEGSIAVDFDRLYVPSNGSALFSIRDAGNNNAIYSYISGSQDQSEIYTSGVVATFNFGTPSSVNILSKISTAYKVNDFAGSRNGSTALTDSSGAVPVSPTYMVIGDTSGSSYLNGHIARLRYFNKRLPNATLQQLSDPDPTLNLQFALNKSLTPVAGPAPSFSRASTGTYFNASGVLTSASINTPRFDHTYSGGQWVSRGLLLEEQRTNLCPYSEDLTNASWTLSGVTISSNAIAAPDGSTTADRLIENTASSGHNIIRFDSGIASGTYTLSCFAKYDSRKYLVVRINDYNTDDNAASVVIDLQTGSITGAATAYGTFSGASANVVDVSNGWYRISLKTVVSSTGVGIKFQLSNDGTRTANGLANSYTGDGTSGAYVWGAQYELGAFATSYIKTTTSTTRSADVCQITGTSFGWMWNQGEGSFSFEADALNPNSVASGQTVYSFDDGSSANSIYGLRSGNTAGSDYLVLSYTSGVEKVNFSNPAGTWLVNVPFKNAIGFKLNDFAQSNNGGSVVTDTNCTMPIGVNQLSIGRLSYAGFPINGHIAKIIYYPARLTNTKLRILSGASPSSFYPSDIAGLQLWLDASDASTLYQSSGGSLASADGDPVGYWTDKSGNGRHASQSDGTKKPTLKTAIQNGRSVLRFDGSTDILVVPSFSLFPSKRGSLFLVYKVANSALPFIYSAIDDTTFAIYGTTSGGTIYKWYDGSHFLGDTLNSANTFYIEDFVRSADTTATYYRNGTLQKTWSVTNSQPPASRRFLGGWVDSGVQRNTLNGDICEILEFSVAVSASERASIQAYLNTKWSTY